MDEQVEEVNKYKLPEGLREAAYARIKSFDGLVGNGTLTENRIDMILEEAKKWYAPEPEKTSCPTCDHGQSLERGEGTHREGTKQHPVEPERDQLSFDTSFGRFEIDDRVSPGEIRLMNWNGPSLVKHIRTIKHTAVHE
jgi:hypothetical protein